MSETTPAAASEVPQSPEAQLEAIFAKRFGEAPQQPLDAAADEDGEPADVDADEPADEAQDGDEDAQEQPAEADAAAAEEDTPAADDDAEEVDIDGEPYKLPKKVRDAVLRHKDYTQKTQELASIRRIAEDRANYFEAANAAMQHAMKEAGAVQAIESQLQQFASIDWDALVTSDPQQAMRLSFARQQAQGELLKRQQALAAVVGQIQQARQAHQAEQTKLGQAELRRRLGTIGEKDQQEMLALAHQLGYEERDLMSPAAVHALSMAAKYRALQASKPQVTKKVAQAKPFVAPAARSSQATAEQSRVAKLKDHALKSGRREAVEDFLTARFAAKR